MNTRTSYFLNQRDRIYVSSQLLKAHNPELEPMVSVTIGDVSIYFPNAESVLDVMEQIAKNMAEISWSNHVPGEYLTIATSSFLISDRD